MTVFFNEDVDQATIDEIGNGDQRPRPMWSKRNVSMFPRMRRGKTFAKQYFEGKEEYKDGFKPNDNPLATSAHYGVYTYTG